MEWALIGIGAIAGLIAFVMCIIVIVKMFQNQQTGLGIGTIVGIFVCGIGYILALIFGWKNKDAWGLGKIMPIFTLCFVLAIVFYGAGYTMLGMKVAKELQNEMQNMGDMEVPKIDFGN